MRGGEGRERDKRAAVVSCSSGDGASVYGGDDMTLGTIPIRKLDDWRRRQQQEEEEEEQGLPPPPGWVAQRLSCAVT